jgi:hypothetical protein
LNCQEVIMKRICVTACMLVVLAACKGEPAAPAAPPPVEVEEPATHAESAPPVVTLKDEAPANEVATFAVPDMSEDLVKSLVGALADEKGVVSAKPDTTAGVIHVTFEPGTINPKVIGEKLSTVTEGVTFEKVAAADSAAPAHQCGGCPMADTCGGKH